MLALKKEKGKGGIFVVVVFFSFMKEKKSLGSSSVGRGFCNRHKALGSTPHCWEEKKEREGERAHSTFEKEMT